MVPNQNYPVASKIIRTVSLYRITNAFHALKI